MLSYQVLKSLQLARAAVLACASSRRLDLLGARVHLREELDERLARGHQRVLRRDCPRVIVERIEPTAREQRDHSELVEGTSVLRNQRTRCRVITASVNQIYTYSI